MILIGGGEKKTKTWWIQLYSNEHVCKWLRISQFENCSVATALILFSIPLYFTLHYHFYAWEQWGLWIVTKCEGAEEVCVGFFHPASGQWSYLECGHGGVPVIPVYGVELGRVVELMVQLRMSFASVHHFLKREQKKKKRKGQQKWIETNKTKEKNNRMEVVWRGLMYGADMRMSKRLRDCSNASHEEGV